MNQPQLARYELWKERDGYSFFPETNDGARKLLLPSAVLVWACEAYSFEDAQTMKREYLGLEPYKP